MRAGATRRHPFPSTRSATQQPRTCAPTERRVASWPRSVDLALRQRLLKFLPRRARHEGAAQFEAHEVLERDQLLHARVLHEGAAQIEMGEALERGEFLH